MVASSSDLAALEVGHDIIRLGVLADDARHGRHGGRTTFVRVANVSSEPGAACAWTPTAGEVRIVGTPASWDAAVGRTREVAGLPGRTGDVPLSGFSLADLEALALARKAPLRDLLEELQAAGLELVAEAPFDLLRSARRSIEEVNIAGLALARLTIHRAAPGSALPLFEQVEALQREVGVVRAFAPLPKAVNPAAPSTGYDDIKRVALARLAVEGIGSIQVDWSLYGPKLAQVALTVGADDVDAVSPVDDDGEGRRRAPLAEVVRNIEAAGLTAVERNGRYELMHR
jgi:hypothetical protein